MGCTLDDSKDCSSSPFPARRTFSKSCSSRRNGSDGSNSMAIVSEAEAEAGAGRLTCSYFDRPFAAVAKNGLSEEMDDPSANSARKLCLFGESAAIEQRNVSSSSVAVAVVVVAAE